MPKAPLTTPEVLAPMLAVAGPMPHHPDRYAFELKWDGVRVLAHLDGRGGVRLQSRSLRDVTVAYPELAGLADALGDTPAVLDGEVVALDDDGNPSFQRLQERMHTADARVARRRAAAVPAVYFAFDLLHLDGVPLLDQPWSERRVRLDGLGLAGPAWAAPPAFVGEGDATLAVARARQLEGVVAKTLTGTYEPGRRSSAWIKHKLLRQLEAVVGGWLPGKGGRSGRIGALLLGLPADSGLRFLGGVGTGFTDAELARLQDRLAPTVTSGNPFTSEAQPARRDAVFVRPELVVDVAYGERTTAGILRHPVYRGVRIDKTPADVDTEGG